MTRPLAILCTLVCFALLAAGPAAGQVDGCYQLLVTATSSTQTPTASVNCTHGYNEGSNPSGSSLVTTLQQSAAYGPNCTITYNVGSNQYVIQAQQDYCSSEAGKITASVQSGNAVITSVTQGSFANGTPGQVAVTLN